MRINLDDSVDSIFGFAIIGGTLLIIPLIAVCVFFFGPPGSEPVCNDARREGEYCQEKVLRSLDVPKGVFPDEQEKPDKNSANAKNERGRPVGHPSANAAADYL